MLLHKIVDIANCYRIRWAKREERSVAMLLEKRSNGNRDGLQGKTFTRRPEIFCEKWEEIKIQHYFKIHYSGGKGNKPEVTQFTYNLDLHSGLLKGDMWNYNIDEVMAIWSGTHRIRRMHDVLGNSWEIS